MTRVCFYLLNMAKTNAHNGRTSPGAVNHLTPRCDWPAAEALISGARSWAQSECATRKIRCAPIFPSTLFPATTFKDYSGFPHRLLFVWHLGIYFWSVYRCVSRSHGKKWDMITLPPESAVFSVLISFGKRSDTGNRSCTRRRENAECSDRTHPAPGLSAAVTVRSRQPHRGNVKADTFRGR